jgi:hypothetical protein
MMGGVTAKKRRDLVALRARFGGQPPSPPPSSTTPPRSNGSKSSSGSSSKGGGKSSSSQYVGVFWSSKELKWRAMVRIGNKNMKKKHLGFFEDEREAALAYNELAVELGRPLNFQM